MDDDYYYQDNNIERYNRLKPFLTSQNLKEFFIENLYTIELNQINKFYKQSIKDKRNLLLKEISRKKNNYTCEDLYEVIKPLLDYNFPKLALINIIEENFRNYNNPQEIINSIILESKILSHLEYFLRINFDNKIFTQKELDKNLFDNNFTEKYLEYKIYENSNNLNEINNFENFKKIFEGKEQKRRKILHRQGKFSYIPLDCNGFCNKIINFFKKNFFMHLFSNSKEIVQEKFLKFNLEDFEELQIFIYKNCIFSHNSYEKNFHFMKYKIKCCYINNCNYLLCSNLHTDKSSKDEMVLLYNSKLAKFINLENLITQKVLEKSNITKITKISQPNLNKIKKDNLNFTYVTNEENSSDSDDELENIFDNIKTQACFLKKLCKDIKSCFNYHGEMERRRNQKDYFIKNNKPCTNVFKESKWLKPSNCPNGDLCEYFHTKTEMMYDRRNFRKLYECYIEKEHGKCYYYNICPYKHNIDINFKEIYLQNEEILILKKNYFINKKYMCEYENLKKELEKENLSTKCTKCNRFIEDVMIIFKCQHFYCEDCLNILLLNKNCIFKCLKVQNTLELNKDYFKILLCNNNLDDYDDEFEDEKCFDFVVESKPENNSFKNKILQEKIEKILKFEADLDDSYEIIDTNFLKK